MLEIGYGLVEFIMTAEAMSHSTRKARWLALAAALLGWMFDDMEMACFHSLRSPRSPN